MIDTIRVDGIDVHIDGPDDAPTIVMVHGWPDTFRLWESQVAALRDSYRCARFTLPGFELGAPRRSHSVDEIAETMSGIVDAVSPTRPVILMLHDFGCAFGYRFTVDAPERVSAVIMFDVGDANSPEVDAELDRTAKILRNGYQRTLAAAWRRGGRGSNTVSRLMAKVLGTHADPTLIHSGMNYPYEAMLGNPDLPVLGAVIAHPTFYLYGTKKPFMFHSRDWSDRLAATEGCAVTAVRAGHWLMVQKADEVNSAITEWLGSTKV
ncbi:hypothetical protein ASG12_06700 [Williamsia sp. Leaf354]|nr:hypothetical protein ASG12_06700 [Williamsia sp. Leaf354]